VPYVAGGTLTLAEEKNMTTIALVNVPARGHINPTLPIVRELVARGHALHYFVASKCRGIVEGVGASFHALPHIERIGAGAAGPPAPPGDRELALLPFVMACQSTEVVPQLVETIRSLGAQCLVYNTLSLWARLAGEFLRLPTVGFRPFHAPRSPRAVTGPFATESLAQLADAAERALAQLAQAFERLPPSLDSLVSQSENPTLIFMPREFAFEAESFDERFLFVGPSLPEVPPEPWPFESTPDGARRRAYVSLGTLRNDDPAFYRLCFSAFEPGAWEVVMSVGERVDLTALAPFPANFLVAPSVRQIAVLPHADVFVTHGGLNSVMESLYFGVPMVVIPSIGEQRLTGSRIGALGLGVALEREAVTRERLRDSASRVARNASVLARIAPMRDRVRAAGGYLRAADAIVQRASRS